MNNTGKSSRCDWAELAARSTRRRKEISDKFARDVSGSIALARDHGATNLDAIAEYLNSVEVKTLRGGAWRGNQVKRVLDRLAGQTVS